MSPRVLFACWPFEGHVFPQISIARALRDRGDTVAFYTGAGAAATIRSEGFELFGFEQVGPEWLRVQEREQSIGGRRQSKRVQRQAFQDWLVETIPGQVADLRRVFEHWQPDVVITDMSMWGPILILSETTRIPVAISSTMMGPFIAGRDVPPTGLGLPPPRDARTSALSFGVRGIIELLSRGVRNRVDAMRATYGLEPMGCSVNEFTRRLPLYLVMGIPELDYGRRDIPPNVRYVGACSWHPPEPPGADDWLDRVPTGRPWVHVTEGTSHYQDPFVLRAASTGLAGTGVEVILTTGRQRDPAAMGLGRLAPNVHAARWVSHGEMMSRFSAVVTTGGPATIMAALREGVPLVVVPTTWDKPDNARRVEDAGVGVRIPPRHCTPERLRAATERVLSDRSYRVAAQSMANRLAAAPGAAGAAELINELVDVGVPASAGRPTGGYSG
jgi:MGT family glycosyltransferase